MVKSADIPLTIQIFLGIRFVVDLLSELIGELSTHSFDDRVTCATIPSAVTSIDVYHRIYTTCDDCVYLSYGFFTFLPEPPNLLTLVFNLLAIASTTSLVILLLVEMIRGLLAFEGLILDHFCPYPPSKLNAFCFGAYPMKREGLK
jgi:hypothetical protein